MKKPELLAPVGNMECLYAAISAGCDAVYLAGHLFGARNYALNFSDEELIEAIKYAHIYGVKVYITVNTIIYEEEVDTFINYVDFLYRNSADALIIQDLGMLDLVRKTYPNLELHASTQMHIHNKEGVLLAKSLGVKRVVLARETPIDKIKYIKENIDMQLEVFIHGALCISYSGECLMSSLIGGRSGNRGTCAQCCRMKYELIDNDKKLDSGYLLSTKDLNTINDIGSLIDIGVDSLKIEGRMKRAEYVYLIVSLYRKAIDNYILYKKTNIKEEDINELRKIFNRGFTKGFIFNEDNNNFINSYRPNHMGVEIGKVVSSSNDIVKIKLYDDLYQNDGIRIIDSKDIGFNINKMYIDKKLVNMAKKGSIVSIEVKDKINTGAKVVKTTDFNQLKMIREKIKNGKKIPITGVFSCAHDKCITLTLSDNVNTVIYNSEIIPDIAIKNSLKKEQIEKQISKMGDTPYELISLKINMDDNLFVRISDLNQIRREACKILSSKRTYKIPYKKEEYHIDLSDYKYENNTNILVKNLSQLDNINYKYNDIYTCCLEDYNSLNYEHKILKLPRIINEYKENNNLVLIGELGSIYNYKNFITDFSFNVTNSYTIAFLHNIGAKRITLSYELTDKQIENIVNSYHNRYNKHPNLEVIIDSIPEVMIMKYNPLKPYNINKAYLKDKYNNKFKIENKEEYTIVSFYKRLILNKKEYYFKIGINNVRIEV